jgi:hypothetical protein
MVASFLPSPPRPARGGPPSPQLPRQDRHPDKILLEGVDPLTTTICFGHWSKRKRQRSPTLQIWSRSGALSDLQARSPTSTHGRTTYNYKLNRGAASPLPVTLAGKAAGWEGEGSRQGAGDFQRGRRRERGGEGKWEIPKKEGCRWRFLVYDLGERTSLHKWQGYN